MFTEVGATGAGNAIYEGYVCQSDDAVVFEDFF